MPILNMTYGQGNPYQPFHLNAISDLSAIPGNAEATITWTDPGNLVVDSQTLATWVSTKLVRKVGSVPSDSSDGTLVVTETVADTYSVTGYTDTGLTNGTTYYYAAFAVADNGTEIISNTTYVEPGNVRPIITGITYDNKSFSHNSQEQEAQGMCWKTDGTKFYIVGEGSKKVHAYDLSTARDISTASYNGEEFSTTSQTSVPNDIRIDDTGTKMYISDFSNYRIIIYILSTARDISTATYSSASFNMGSSNTHPASFCFGNNGNYLYLNILAEKYIRRYTLSSAYDISSYTDLITYNDALNYSCNGLKINPQGTQLLFNYRDGPNKIGCINLNTAWDLSSASTTYFTSSYGGDYMVLSVGDNGNKLYYGARTGSGSPAASQRTIYQYSTTTS